MNRLLTLSRKVLPWLIAAGIFYLLFERYPFNNVIAAMRLGHWPLLIGYFLLFFSLGLFFDIWSLAKIFSRLAVKTSPRDLITPRCASFLMLPIHFHAAQASLAYFLKKEKGVPISKTIGIQAFLNITDLYLLLTISFISSWWVDPHWIDVRFLKIPIYGWLLGNIMLFLLISTSRLLFRKKGERWIDHHPLLHAFRTATIGDYLAALLVRLPSKLLLCVSFFFVAIIFGVRIPIMLVVTFMPYVFLIGALPITPMGLGTGQAARIALFSQAVSLAMPQNASAEAPELILAMSLAALFITLLITTLVGSLYFNRVMNGNRLSATASPTHEPSGQGR